MYMLHEKSKTDTPLLIPKEGQQDISCSNEVSVCCPSFGIYEGSEDKTAKQLAEIIFNLWQKQLKLNTMDLPIQE